MGAVAIAHFSGFGVVRRRKSVFEVRSFISAGERNPMEA
jgi:hypothetical protein